MFTIYYIRVYCKGGTSSLDKVHILVSFAQRSHCTYYIASTVGVRVSMAHSAILEGQCLEADRAKGN